MILVFGGTYDAKEYVLKLLEQGEKVIVSTLTAYGASLYPKHENLIVSHGKLSKEQKIHLIQTHGVKKIVDYTHPYATGITETLKELTAELGLDYERIERAESSIPKGENVLTFEHHEDVVNYLNQTEGNVLMTIGSFQLAEYKKVKDISRLYLRVLPTIDSLEKCFAIGVKPNQIIAMQGPFSYAFNQVLIKDLDISILVTKDSGTVGGTMEKVNAALDLDKEVCLVTRPV